MRVGKFVIFTALLLFIIGEAVLVGTLLSPTKLLQKNVAQVAGALPAGSITVAYNGTLRDKVSPARVLSPDGALDGTLQVTFNSGTKTLTKLLLIKNNNSGGNW